MAQALRAQPTQVEGDLVVAGKYGRNPATVRFSSDPQKPPVVIQLQVPLLPWLNAGNFTSGQQAYFSFSVVPRESVVKERGTIMPIGNQTLDSRFLTRCDNPAGAKPFLQDKQTQAELQKLCCSPKTSFRINGVNMEVTEMAGAQNGRHILAHLESMGKLAGAAAVPPVGAAKQTRTGLTASFQLPTTVALPKFLGERGPVFLVAGAALLIVVAIGWNMLRVNEEEPTGPPPGVAAADAALIPDVNHWALVEDKDLSAAGVDWVRRQGQTPAARISGDFAGGGSADVAYVLKRRGGMLRVVLLSRGKNRYDTNFSPLALVARVPKAALDSIQWTDKVPGAPDGDGLLIVRNTDDPNTAVVVMLTGGKVITGRPPTYRDLRLQ
ncbi:MAG: hypothetical protein ACRD3A_02515 [Terriglobales bacterium]